MDEEVNFRENDSPIPPIPVTAIDMDVILKGWEEKFEHLSRCLRDVQLASERAASDMCDANREGRARSLEQDRRLQTMHVGLTEFLQKCEPTHLSAAHQISTPTASTPYSQSTPTGHPARIRPEFGFQPSPVDHEESARSTLPHIRSARTEEHDAFRDTRTRDQEIAQDTRIREHDAFRDFQGRAQGPRSGDHTGHAHPGTRRFQGRAHPRVLRRSGQRTTYSRHQQEE